MTFDLDQRRVQMSVGELSDFSIGPQDSGGGSAGLWRAQLGTHWHRALREQALGEDAGARFEVPVSGALVRRGWTVQLSGRIDQIVEAGGSALLREIKTVMRPLPAGEAELRSEYPGYFVQLAVYAALRGTKERGDLVFVEADTGLAQNVPLRPSDEQLVETYLERIAEFLELRLRARERLRGLRFRPPFAAPRPGQESVAGELTAAVRGARSAVLLEAPTGFGKTGVLLECALAELRAGHFDRTVYLTGKSTGQLHVSDTLRAMTAPGPDLGGGPSVAAWHVRNKAEHCVNAVFQCVRERCAFLDGAEGRWPQSGLSRFYLLEDTPRDLDTLRSAGAAARICPYEITRAALAFNDVWIGDYNYVFSPDTRGLFFERPGFEPGRTLLLIDEAHNLPSRAADAHSHAFVAADARAVGEALRQVGAPSAWAARWDDWAGFLDSLPQSRPLSEPQIEDGQALLAALAEGASQHPLDASELGADVCSQIWSMPSTALELESTPLERLWWSPRPGELAITCLDAAPAVGAALAEFGGVVLATATPGPVDRFAEACGIGGLEVVRAPAPWRTGAYDVAVDLRVDTSFQQRQRHLEATAQTVAALQRSAGPSAPVAVFFSSYAYAEAVAARVPGASLQPRRTELAAQRVWIEDAIEAGQALFLVLGSSFAEGVDLLGGRVSAAMVVGPALPEVNAVQRARLAVYSEGGRDAAFDRVYRIPGMQKVNQALGRLVRAPGQRARILLHCRRFAEPGYERLLDLEYQGGRRIGDDAELDAWLGAGG